MTAILIGLATIITALFHPATGTTPAPVADNWMVELVPSVDPGGLGVWVFERNGGMGASDGHTVFIDPAVTPDKRFSVMAHEYAHLLQAQQYGSLTEARLHMNIERQADCVALDMGATWAHYGCNK